MEAATARWWRSRGARDALNDRSPLFREPTRRCSRYVADSDPGQAFDTDDEEDNAGREYMAGYNETLDWLA